MAELTDDPHRLTDLTGIDRERADRLRDAGFRSVDHVGAASQRQLQSVDGIPSGLAGRLLVETEHVEPGEQVRAEVAELQPDPPVEETQEETEAEPIESLTDITGVDSELARRLREQGFRTVEHVSAARKSQLQTVEGIGGPFAARILSETEAIDVSPELREEVVAEMDEEPTNRWSPDVFLVYALLAVGAAAAALYSGATTVGIGLIVAVVVCGTLYDLLLDGAD